MADPPPPERLTVPAVKPHAKLIGLLVAAAGVWLMVRVSTAEGVPDWLSIVASILVILGLSSLLRGGYTFDRRAGQVVRWIGTGVHVPWRRMDLDEVDGVSTVKQVVGSGPQAVYRVELVRGDEMVVVKKCPSQDEAEELAEAIAGVTGLPVVGADAATAGGPDVASTREAAEEDVSGVEERPEAGPPEPEEGAPAVPPPPARALSRAEVAVIRQRDTLEKKLRSASSWFYAIAGFSIVNSVLMLVGASWAFLVGLGITQLIAAFGRMAAQEWSPLFRYAAFTMEVAVAILFFLFGYLGRRRWRSAFVIGMVLYALDSLILLWAQDMISFGFHILALLFLFGGLKAAWQLRTMDKAAAGAKRGEHAGIYEDAPPA